MHNMPDYGFYTDVYAGTMLKPGTFSQMLRQAVRWLEMLEQRCRVVAYGPESRKMALCAAAEELYRYRTTERIAQSAIGSVSIRYEKSEPLSRRLLQSVAGYLEIYRGVG